MSDWFDPLGTADQLLPVSEGALGDWPDGRFRTSEARLVYIPVAMSELYIVGQSLPLTGLQTKHGPLLVAELKAGGRSVVPFDDNGQWRLPYRPMALRLLPLIAQADGSCWRLESKPAQSTNTAAQNAAQILQAFSGFAHSVQTASTLLRAAIKAQLLWFDKDADKGPRLMHLNQQPAELPASQAQICRVVEIMRFSQQAKGAQTGRANQQNQMITGVQRAFEPEKILSFDEDIRFS